MSVKSIMLGLAGTLLALTAWSQEVKREIREGTVIYGSTDQLVVKMADGTVKVYPVPAGRTVNINGKEVGPADLKPGTKLTQTIVTTSTPRNVQSVRTVKGTVMNVMAPWVTVRLADGNVKRYKAPADMKFNVEGNPNATVFDLRQGMKLTAQIHTTTPEVEVSQRASVAGVAPPAPKPVVVPARPPEVALLIEEVETTPAPPPVAKAAPPADPTPAPAAPAALPKTASPLPLIGIAGALLAAAGAALRYRRLRG
jgi:hypothetical protein